MNIDDLYEKTMENILYVNNKIQFHEIIYDYLVSHGYVVTMHYSKNESSRETQRTFHLFNFYRENERPCIYSWEDFDINRVNLEKEIKHDWQCQNAMFETVDDLDLMYELSSNLPFVMSFAISDKEEEFSELCYSVLIPIVRFMEKKLRELKDGIKNFSRYEKLIGIFLNVYFISENFSVITQKNDSSNQHRRDFFIRIKRGRNQDFNRLIEETSCRSIVAECKNSMQPRTLKAAINQINTYSRASSFGKLGLIFLRKKGNPYKITDYTNSDCIIIVLDDSDIYKWINNIEFSYNRYEIHKDRSRFISDINGCADIFERYQEICEKIPGIGRSGIS